LNKKLNDELDKLNNEIAAANKTINHYKYLYQEAEQQAKKYQKDLCKAAEELKLTETKVRLHAHTTL